MNGFAGIFGGLLGYAIGHITSGLPQWMYVFLIFGAVSFAWGVVFLVFMPDLPTTTRFLSQREAVIAVDRVAANRQGVKNHHFKRYQMWQTFSDPKTWILFIMAVAAQIPNALQTSVSRPICPHPPPAGVLYSSQTTSLPTNFFNKQVHVHHTQDLRVYRPADPVYANTWQCHPDRLSPGLGLHQLALA
jgi:MFS family permease